MIVEDNSPDGTLQVARDLQQIYGKDQIVILPREGKLGLDPPTATASSTRRATSCSSWTQTCRTT